MILDHNNRELVHIVFGEWVVFTNGDLANTVQGFYITWDRLTENNWILEGIKEDWNMNEFCKAYYHACKVIGLTNINFIIDYD